MRRTATLAAVALAWSGLAAELRLVGADSAESLGRELAAAGDGMRFVACGHGLSVNGNTRFRVLLESAARGSELRVVEAEGALSSERAHASLDPLLASGFRIAAGGILTRRIQPTGLPATAYRDQVVVILERRPGSPAGRYAAVSFGSRERLERDLEALAAPGLRWAGMTAGARRFEIVAQGPLAPPGNHPAKRYRLLMEPTRTLQRMALRRASRRGLRIVAAERAPVPGPPMHLMESVEDPGYVHYRFLDDVDEKLRKNRLAEKLERKARHRWRVLPAASTAEFLILERRPGDDRRFTYRTVATSEPGFLDTLGGLRERGFRVIKLFVEPSGTTVLLERDGLTADSDVS